MAIEGEARQVPDAAGDIGADRPHGEGRGHSSFATADSPGHVDDEQGKQKRKRKDQSIKLDCTICTEEHYTNQCPLLRGPKPTIAFCGAADDGMGFFQIQAARTNHIASLAQSSVAALITVDAGVISAQLLQSELSRIIPVRWEWEVQELDATSFVVPFPSKEELDRMTAIRTITMRNKEATIIFEEFIDDVQPIKVLEQAWVTVTKVPRVLRSFLPLWAVGTMIGATQKVDMAHLRATGQVRILVAVFDAQQIAKHADVCVGNKIYRLFFKPDDVLHYEPIDPEEDDLLSDGDNDKGLGGEDQAMQDAEDHLNPPSSLNDNTNSGTPQAHPPNMPPQKQAALIEKSLNIACEQLIQEISLKVMIEQDEGEARKTYSPPTEAEIAAYLAAVEPAEVVFGEGGSTPPMAPSHTDQFLPLQVDGMAPHLASLVVGAAGGTTAAGAAPLGDGGPHAAAAASLCDGGP